MEEAVLSRCGDIQWHRFCLPSFPIFFPTNAQTFNFACVIFGSVTVFGILSWYFVPEEKWLRREQVLQALAVADEPLHAESFVGDSSHVYRSVGVKCLSSNPVRGCASLLVVFPTHPSSIICEEVSFDDIQDLDRAKGLEGYRKIQACCARALADGYRWVWIDTCCINKNSSAELSEAINSMYAWYQKSGVRYAFLDDAIRSGAHYRHCTLHVLGCEETNK
ncbi:hypothetical protein A0H81_08128 [Grifola frondosa]|uniref:Heterokaryon incompatibility domain-containing protein n=1 Tax=Grifola frondosa TaxID=5627 RepID=A0A1C7M530_GRIFR|nr:hypothetical protein A0H81_08128 [Grifola frondosa]